MVNTTPVENLWITCGKRPGGGWYTGGLSTLYQQVINKLLTGQSLNFLTFLSTSYQQFINKLLTRLVSIPTLYSY